MDVMRFHRMRTAIQANAWPGSESELTTVEGSLRHKLLGCGLFDAVEVERTDDPDQLVIALCQFRADAGAEDVARAIEELWDRVSYPFWEAHAMILDPDLVEFEGASRESLAGGYVTVHLVAEKSRIPAQRVPADQPARMPI